jgi:hypothetical protein
MAAPIKISGGNVWQEPHSSHKAAKTIISRLPNSASAYNIHCRTIFLLNPSERGGGKLKAISRGARPSIVE